MAHITEGTPHADFILQNIFRQHKPLYWGVLIMSIDIDLAVLNDLVYIDSLQKKNAEDLAFYPKIVFEREIENRRIILARVNGEPAGYIYHGALGVSCKIHQACIEYDLRGQLYGSKLVQWLQKISEISNCHYIILRCGSDIEANAFWQRMGFYCQSVTQGGIRRMRDINTWRLDLQPTLFINPVDPSSKQKDSSIWRKNKDKIDRSNITGFQRGKALKQYRDQIVALQNKGEEL